ncbi:hypothetical protein M218_28240 [Burkholderia pseudomallei MSHR338]|nr:hypothetical protein M218_28240 [Burkholderia pseudomallei MSHR338]
MNRESADAAARLSAHPARRAARVRDASPGGASRAAADACDTG